MNFSLPELHHQIYQGQREHPWDIPPASWTVQVFEQVDSTNQTLWELATQGATAGTVAIALSQRSGRGQWGRQWHSALGGLYLSVLLEPDLAADLAGQLTLATVWGMATELRQAGVPVGVKWPNDLVCDRRKLGGILTETRLRGERIRQAVIGVGVNWSNPVPETGIALKPFLEQSTHNTVPLRSLEGLAAIVLAGIHRGEGTLKRKGIEAILPLYEDLLTHRGASVLVEGEAMQILGVTDRGYLRVRPAGAASSADRVLAPGTIHLGYGPPAV